jgi:hypothetical protein
MNYKKTNVRSVKLAKLIIIESLIGEGTTSNPSRIIKEIYDLKGRLIARFDPFFEEEDK